MAQHNYATRPKKYTTKIHPKTNENVSLKNKKKIIPAKK
jgi:hypothetical protein